MAKDFLNNTGLPIGLRNNNPGNLRPGDNWQGMTGQNGGFVVFQNLAYGIRALTIDVGNDIRLDGLNTIRKLIGEFAPPSENNTAAYISTVVASTGFGADQVIPPSQDALKRIIRAIINVEVGPQYAHMVTDQDITQGMGMAHSDILSYFSITPGKVIGFGGLLLAGLIGWFLIRK